MRVVTVENFGKMTPELAGDAGYIYEGDSWVFRFQIGSVDHFFRDEIPNLVDNVFKIDPRQIMRLVLYGKPGVGLYDARVCISFQEPPKEDQVASLQMEAQPSAGGSLGDNLDDLFLELLKDAAPSRIRSLARSVEQSTSASVRIRQGKKTSLTSANYIFCSGSGKIQSGNLLRLQWVDECTPCIRDWNNANFLLAEALRQMYTPQNFVRFEFRAVPDTEAAYEMLAEVFVEGPLRLYPIRLTRRQRKSLGKLRATPPAAEKDGIVEFVPCQHPYSELNEAGQNLVDKLGHLPMKDRLVFWQRHVARCFR